MIKLNKTQLKELDKFIEHYMGSINAASGSLVDANANVTEKNIITMLGELLKPIHLQFNRYKRFQQIEKDFGYELAEQYIKDIDHHTIYCHDETKGMVPYCASISLFPFLMNGSVSIGGNTEKPKHLSSFCGGFINLMNQIASQVAGAIATPSFLVCFDFFARKDYGDDYLKTHENEIKQELQHVVYYLNEPCSGRDGQSIFWNLSMFDSEYMEGLYSEFVYPEDFSKVNFESVKNLQKFFLSWFNQERTKKLLTFPVITCAMVYGKDRQVKDKEFKSLIAKELADGSGFFTYLSDNVDSLSSCCRLRNESKNSFSYTLGNVGEMTGSVHVITINFNRFIQDTMKKYTDSYSMVSFDHYLKEELSHLLRRIHKYHVSTRAIYKQMVDGGMYPIYDAHFIEMNRQFSTIGINGMVEAAEFLGYDIVPGGEYENFCSEMVQLISELNKKAREEYGVLYNSEFVPAENLGHKNAMWDKKDGYQVNRDCYNSYFYRVEDENLTIIDKAKLHGKSVVQYLDGGSAAHFNLDDYLDQAQYEKLIDICIALGVNYFCTNIKVTCCENQSCGFINKKTENHCTKCGSAEVSHATRIIGYLRKTTNFSKERQTEESLRNYHKNICLQTESSTV